MQSLLLSTVLAAAAAAQSTTTLCSAGQCLQGTSNITSLGGILTAPDANLVLLPGDYSATVQPQQLLSALTSSTSRFTLTTGFANPNNSASGGPPSLPLSIALQPGLLSYPQDLYAGTPEFFELPANSNVNVSSPLDRGSIVLSANTWAAIEATSGSSKARTIIWDSVPYISQLPPSMAGQLTLLDIQSSSCSPACSSVATCSNDGRCICPPGFSGETCDVCALGFFGPNCQACPEDCSNCDQGISGTGVCLTTPVPAEAPSNCNCANGVCSPSGQCTCATGWTTAAGSGANSLACSTCATGFSLSATTNNCEACPPGCTTCNSSGQCTRCATGLNLNAGGTCEAPADSCVSGSILDPATGSCVPCAGNCRECSGPSPRQCTQCNDNTFFVGGECITASAAGKCAAGTVTGLVANNNKRSCDTCPLGCTDCEYPSFSRTSAIEDVQCTRCLPGMVLADRRCVSECPAGQFVGADGFTCTACSSSCGTCTGSADFCLTCKSSGQVAFDGRCQSSCPTNTFSSDGACRSCHPDCASCSGPNINQCSSCPSTSPVLTSDGRCLPTCTKSEYLDPRTGRCITCDSSCGSCSAAGPSGCLSCANANTVLRAGQCVSVNCGDNQTTVPGLGVCLAELVQVPNEPPNVDIPPVDEDAQENAANSGKKGLEWWQILLIVLGALAIVVLGLIVWRRHARKKRAQQTQVFANNLKAKGLWARLWNPFEWFKSRSKTHTAVAPRDPEAIGDDGWRHEYHRDTSLNVPRSISRGSWLTMTQHTNRRPSIDARTDNDASSFFAAGAINQRVVGDDGRSGRSQPTASSFYRDGSSRRPAYNPGPSYSPPSDRESQFGKEIVQDSRSEMTYGARSTSSRSKRDRYRDERYDRGDYPSSFRSRGDDSSTFYERRDRHYYNTSERPSSPSLYSTVTSNKRTIPRPRETARGMPPDIPEVPLLSSRFSVTTTAESVHPQPPRVLRKEPPPVPELVLTEPPRQLTDAEMYKMSKLFPELSTAMPANYAVQEQNKSKQPVIVDKNPFRNGSF